MSLNLANTETLQLAAFAHRGLLLVGGSSPPQSCQRVRAVRRGESAQADDARQRPVGILHSTLSRRRRARAAR